MPPIGELKLIRCGLVNVKTLASHYGMSKSTVYELIKTDPNFPCINTGVKKKFMIDVAKFEIWMSQRTEKQKSVHFAFPLADELMRRFKK